MDPDRGHSPWQRGVRGDQQVLVCPRCQEDHGWADDLDHCGQCGSARLVRRLGEMECRECGHVVSPQETASLPADEGLAPGLSEEVALALDRVLGRGSRRSAPVSSP